MFFPVDELKTAKTTAVLFIQLESKLVYLKKSQIIVSFEKNCINISINLAVVLMVAVENLCFEGANCGMFLNYFKIQCRQKIGTK